MSMPKQLPHQQSTFMALSGMHLSAQLRTSLPTIPLASGIVVEEVCVEHLFPRLEAIVACQTFGE